MYNMEKTPTKRNGPYGKLEINTLEKIDPFGKTWNNHNTQLKKNMGPFGKLETNTTPYPKK